MAEDPENIVLSYLRRLDERTARIEDGLRDTATDLRILKDHMAAFMRFDAGRDGTVASIQARLACIERRLDLVDTPAG